MATFDDNHRGQRPLGIPHPNARGRVVIAIPLTGAAIGDNSAVPIQVELDVSEEKTDKPIQS
jgi:hypothetical protein